MEFAGDYIFSSVVGMLTVAFASLCDTKGQEGFGPLFVVFGGFMVVDFFGLTPNPVFDRSELLSRVRWPLLITAASLAWPAMFYGIRYRRRTGESLLQSLGWRFRRFDLPLSELWRPSFPTPRSPLDAVIELDWRRCYEGFVVAGSVSISFLLITYTLAEDHAVFSLWLVVGAIAPFSMYFVTRQFSSYDEAKNGAFRSTLPVSDKDLAHGMLRFLFRSLVAVWFMWMIGACILLVVNFVQGRNLIDELQGFRRLGPSGTGMLLVVRTYQLFRFAYIARLFSGRQIWNLSMLWLVLTVACATPIAICGLGIGIVVLCAGVLALAFYAWAALPFAIQVVRHWYHPSPGE